MHCCPATASAAATSALTCISMPHHHVEEFPVATTSDAEELSEALFCDGPESFVVSWHGNVILSHTLSVSNGSTLNVASSSDCTDGDSDAVIFSDGTVLLFEVDSGSTASLTGLTFSGGDGAVRVNGESFVEVIDCSFVDNKITSSDFGGGLTVRISLKFKLPRIRDSRIRRTFCLFF